MITIQLISKTEIAHDTFLYAFERPKDFTFVAGQYVSMRVMKTSFHDEKGDFRSFSIASPPYREDVLEFAMRKGPSAFKKNLQTLEVGESLEITPAVGKSVLPNPDPNRGVVFLAGGVGITPVRSILFQSQYEKRPEKFFLLNSNRTPEDSPFLGELNAISGIDLIRVYTMTNMELSSQVWTGETDRINIEMVRKYVTMDLQACLFYIVGIGVFVQAMRNMLYAEGIADENIVSDDFGGSAK